MSVDGYSEDGFMDSNDTNDGWRDEPLATNAISAATVFAYSSVAGS
jgi:hypothetical protein